MKHAISDASNDDLNAIAEMNEKLHEIHYKNYPDHFKPFNKIEVINWFKIGIGNPKGKLLIAKDGNIYLGYVFAMIHERKENPFCIARRYIEVDHIYVDENYRNNGIGKRLLNEIIRFAKQKNVNEIELTTWNFNKTAINSFENYGFKTRYCRYNLKT
jgi:GNAT superfamily N-acetyltransferase